MSIIDERWRMSVLNRTTRGQQLHTEILRAATLPPALS